ncbi:MAG TPA: quinoprotein relay system zinc metallohydrolase 2 [Stellaceae bacterium]
MSVSFAQRRAFLHSAGGAYLRRAAPLRSPSAAPITGALKHRRPALRAAVIAVVVTAWIVVSTKARGEDAAPLMVTEIASGIFVHAGVQQDASAANDDAIANIGFILGDDAVAVVDPGGSYREGEALRAAIRARTALPIRYVIMTHVHPDHIFGAAAFRADGPEFVGHAKLPGALAERGEYYLRRLRETLGPRAEGSAVVAPTRLVAAKLDLDLGNRRLEIVAHGPAHTDNDLSVYDDKTRTFWLADLLFVGRIPVVDGSLVGWLKELGSLTAIAADRAVPGHGPPSVPWPASAAAERRYLETLAHDTRAALKGGLGIAEAVPKIGQSERGRWLLFDDYNARNATASYKELEWE